jgi:hypothetical protein
MFRIDPDLTMCFVHSRYCKGKRHRLCKTENRNPDYFDADADPDSAFHSDADPDPTF